MAVGPTRFIVVYSWHCHILGDVLGKYLLTETNLMLSLVLKYDFLVVEMDLHHAKYIPPLCPSYGIDYHTGVTESHL